MSLYDFQEPISTKSILGMAHSSWDSMEMRELLPPSPESLGTFSILADSNNPPRETVQVEVGNCHVHIWVQLNIHNQQTKHGHHQSSRHVHSFLRQFDKGWMWSKSSMFPGHEVCNQLWLWNLFLIRQSQTWTWPTWFAHCLWWESDDDLSGFLLGLWSVQHSWTAFHQMPKGSQKTHFAIPIKKRTNLKDHNQHTNATIDITSKTLKHWQKEQRLVFLFPTQQSPPSKWQSLLLLMSSQIPSAILELLQQSSLS